MAPIKQHHIQLVARHRLCVSPQQSVHVSPELEFNLNALGRGTPNPICIDTHAFTRFPVLPGVLL